MQVTEIVKLTGKSKEEVAGALGIPREGSYWFAKVDDTVAKEYIMASGDGDTRVDEPNGAEGQPPAPESTQDEPVAKMAQFWSTRRAHNLPSDSTMERGDILFNDWTYIAESQSPEAKFLRSDIARDKIGIREVYQVSYDDPEVIAEFILYLESLIFTGLSKSDGASREGASCARAILSAEDQSGMEPVDQNSPKQLIRAITRSKSMNVQAFGTGV